MDHYFKEPFSAAIIAGAVVVGYVFIKAKMNNEGKVKNSDYFKNAFMVALLVYFIVSQGQGSHEPIMKEPF
jgi:uncharacterized membrane protein